MNDFYITNDLPFFNDIEFQTKLTNLINLSYYEGEQNILPWDNDKHKRTDVLSKNIKDQINDGEIFCLFENFEKANLTKNPIGTVRLEVCQKTNDVIVGQFAISSEFRRQNLGSLLMNHVIQHFKKTMRTSEGSNHKKLKIELLKPLDNSHAFKDFLHVWYQKLGFKLVSRVCVDQHPIYSELSKITLCHCEFLEYEFDFD